MPAKRNPSRPSDKSDMSDPSDASDPAWEVMAPSTASDPAELIAKINDDHARATNSAAHAMAHGIAARNAAMHAGLMLVKLREATPHGQWETLFASGMKRVGKANATKLSHLEFDSRTALRYIQFAAGVVSQKLQPEQNAVLMELSNGGAMTQAAADLFDEIIPAKTKRQAMLALGIIQPTPKEAAAMAAPPADPAAATPEPKAAAAFRSAKDSARIDWYGTPKPGRVEPGSFMGLVLTEITDPARGSARLLTKADLDGMAADLTEFARRLREYAKEKR